jgi:hypothetical protein
VDEAAVGIVTAADIPQRVAEVPELLVGHSLDDEVDGLAEVVVRVGGVLPFGVRAEPADDLDGAPAEVIA